MSRWAPRQLDLPGCWAVEDVVSAVAQDVTRIRLPHHQSLERVLALMLLLRSARTGYTYRALAERYGVEPRTIRRDLETLRAIGCAIVVTPAGRGDEPLRIGKLTLPEW